MSEAWPEELKLRDRGATLEITFDTGAVVSLTAELLRVESPSAEVKGHGPGQEVTVAGKKNVRIRKLDPVGNYAVRIGFDDGHNSGLYTWTYLLKMGAEKEELWTKYLEALAAKGLSRS
jgi:DUF971 family protein